jgi:hypothetical protein
MANTTILFQCRSQIVNIIPQVSNTQLIVTQKNTNFTVLYG